MIKFLKTERPCISSAGWFHVAAETADAGDYGSVLGRIAMGIEALTQRDDGAAVAVP